MDYVGRKRYYLTMGCGLGTSMSHNAVCEDTFTHRPRCIQTMEPQSVFHHIDLFGLILGYVKDKLWCGRQSPREEAPLPNDRCVALSPSCPILRPDPEIHIHCPDAENLSPQRLRLWKPPHRLREELAYPVPSPIIGRILSTSTSNAFCSRS